MKSARGIETKTSDRRPADAAAARRPTLAAPDVTKTALTLVAVGVGLATVWTLADVLMLFFGAILVAIQMRALGGAIEYLGVPERAAIIAGLLTLIALVVGFGLAYGRDLASQSQELVRNFDAAVSGLLNSIDMGPLERYLSNGEAAAGLMPLIPRFLSWGVTAGGALFSVVLVVVGGLYLALDPASSRKGFVKLIPPSYHANANATLDDIGEALHRWVHGQVLAMAIMGVLSATGLWLAGVPSPLALGVLAGVANFVPYFGSLAAAAVTVVVASSQGFETVLLAAGVMIGLQQLESYAVTPLVVGRAVSISPVAGMFAIVAMAVLFGPLGILFGFPLAIVADIAIRRLYIRDALDEPVEILGDPAVKSSEASTPAA